MEINIHPPGEARTHGLRISFSVLTYNYDVLTDCATGADILGIISAGKHYFKDSSMFTERIE